MYAEVEVFKYVSVVIIVDKRYEPSWREFVVSGYVKDGMEGLVVLTMLNDDVSIAPITNAAYITH